MESGSSLYFTDIIETETELREVMGEPGGLALGKQLDRLDHHCRQFVALLWPSHRSCLSAPPAPVGPSMCPPEATDPGFVLVLDEKTLVIPERPGNRRLDSLLNVLETGSIGLLFLVPGFEETLRVNGRASVVRDPDILERMVSHGKRPQVAIAVEVQECFLHCAKAFQRSRLWQIEGWPERSVMPPLGRMLRDQGAVVPGVSADELESGIPESYARNLY